MDSKNKKVGIILDTGSSLKDSKLSNIVTVPLILNEIKDGETFSYEDGIDLTREEIYEKIRNGAKLSTSQAIFGQCLEVLEKMLTKYDEVLVFPLSKELSGTYDTWKQVLREFEGNKNIHLFDLLDVAYGTYLGAVDAYNMFMKGSSPEEIQKYLYARSKRREAVIIINDLDTLVRGGRLSSFKGKIAKFLNLKVLVAFTEGKLDVLDKTTNIGTAVKKSLKSIDSHIHFVEKGIKNILVVFNATSEKDPFVQEYKNHVVAWLEENKVKGRENIVLDFLPSIISVHTGIDTAAVWIEANE
ncbi:MAG: DegV family protein [Mycoplasmoidaceae bacterium]